MLLVALGTAVGDASGVAKSGDSQRLVKVWQLFTWVLCFNCQPVVKHVPEMRQVIEISCEVSVAKESIDFGL